jgi:hypothetical protein
MARLMKAVNKGGEGKPGRIDMEVLYAGAYYAGSHEMR